MPGPAVTSNAWERLSVLVAYPKVPPASRLEACGRGWAMHPPVLDALARFERGIAEMPLTDLQECYSEVFDFGTACTLDLGWHLFGETRDRGLFLSALVEDLARAGVARSTELPDHLTHVLALIGREEPGRAETLASLVEPAVEAIRRALAERGSVYAPLLDAVQAALETLAVREPADGIRR